jgi:hypothetical protein
MLFLSGCGGLDNTKNKVNFTNADIAVIETATWKNTSFIKLYDKSGKMIAENPINCVDIGTDLIPLTYNSKIYCESIGGYSNRSKKVAEFDLLNDKYSTYEINIATLSIAANDNYIFTTNTGAKSVITKYDIKKQIIVGTLDLSGLVTHIKVVGNKLFAFANNNGINAGTTISIIDIDNLNIEKSIERQSELTTQNSIQIGDLLYFNHVEADMNSPSRTLSTININEYTITDIELSEYYPYQLKQYKDSLLITNYFMHSQYGNNKLTVLNLSTNKENVITFNHELKQIEVKDNKLYATDGNNIYIYDIDNDFQLINKFEIKSDKDKYRITRFFLTK